MFIKDASLEFPTYKELAFGLVTDAMFFVWEITDSKSKWDFLYGYLNLNILILIFISKKTFERAIFHTESIDFITKSKNGSQFHGIIETHSLLCKFYYG